MNNYKYTIKSKFTGTKRTVIKVENGYLYEGKFNNIFYESSDVGLFNNQHYVLTDYCGMFEQITLLPFMLLLLPIAYLIYKLF